MFKGPAGPPSPPGWCLGIYRSVPLELDGWRRRVRIPGKYFDVFDGEITKNLKATNGTNFFRNDLGDLNGPNGELRIAVTLGVDWYVH